MDQPWRIVIPLRLSQAKTRLATQPAPRRRDLVIAMAQDVIAAARACSRVSQVVLVADEDGLASVIPVAPGVIGILDPGTGLNAAILAGAEGAEGPVAALLADVPCATADALALALGACTDGRGFVCDAEGIGTTLLAAPSVEDLDPRFGPRSRAAHAAAGTPEILDPVPAALVGLRRDVDSEVDLWDARRIGVGAFTRAAMTQGDSVT